MKNSREVHISKKNNRPICFSISKLDQCASFLWKKSDSWFMQLVYRYFVQLKSCPVCFFDEVIVGQFSFRWSNSRPVQRKNPRLNELQFFVRFEMNWFSLKGNLNSAKLPPPPTTTTTLTRVMAMAIMVTGLVMGDSNKGQIDDLTGRLMTTLPSPSTSTWSCA